MAFAGLEDDEAEPEAFPEAFVEFPPLALPDAVATAPEAPAFPALPGLVEFDAPPLTLPVAEASAATAPDAVALPALVFDAEADWCNMLAGILCAIESYGSLPLILIVQRRQRQ